MQFIAISPDILINPEMISKIEKSKDGKKIILTVDGEQVTAEIDFNKLYALLIGAGLEKTTQFWAG